MKQKLLLPLVLLCASLCFGQALQQNFPIGTIPFAGVPSGSCGPAQNAINTATGVYYFCNNGVWAAIANNTFPTANTVTEATNTVTATTVSGNWPAAFQPGASISETGCSVGGYNITATILSGGGGGPTLTFTDPTGSLGAASGCTGNVSSSSGGTITGVTAGTGLTGGGTSGNVTMNVTLPVASATSAAQLNGLAVPASKTIVGTNPSGQLVDATSATLSNNTTGNANTASNATLAAAATALAATPTNCGPGIAATGITANGTPVNCFTPSGTLPGGVIQGTVPVTGVGPGFSEAQQTKPLPDTRDDPLAGPNVCTRYNDLGNSSAVYPTAATASGSGSVVTYTTASGNWGPDFLPGVTNGITVVGCATGGYNGTFSIASITPPSNTFTVTNATTGSGTGCQVFANLGTVNPLQMTLQGEISNTNAACTTTNISNPKTQGWFNGQTVLNTDLGFNISTWQEIKGTLSDVVGVQAQVNQTGSALKATNLFPNVNLTATGTAGQSTISITNTSGDAFNLSPGTPLQLPTFQVTGVTGTCSGCTVSTGGTGTLTAGANWSTVSALYVPGAVVTISNCSSNPYSETTPILSGGGATTSFTFAINTVNAPTAGVTGCTVNLASGDGVSGGYYYVSKCISGAACANTVGGVNTSQFYAFGANSTLTVNIKPALASSPSATPVTLMQPIANLGDITAQNSGQTGIANDWSRVTGFHINGTNIPGFYTCVGAMDPFAQEGSWFRDVTIAGCGFGLWLPQPVDAGPFETMNVGYSNDLKCPGVTVPIQIVGQATSIRRVTINGNNCEGTKESLGLLHITDSPYNASTIPGGLVVEQFHMEGGCVPLVQPGGICSSPAPSAGILVDSMYAGGNGATGTVLIQGGTTCPPAFPCLSAVELGSTFNGTLGLHQVSVQNGGGSTNAFKNDITGNSYLVTHNQSGNAAGIGFVETDLNGSEFSNLNPTDMQTGSAANVYNGVFHSSVMTTALSADSGGITATTAATAVTQFLWNNTIFQPNLTYAFHCSGTTTQATAGAGIGIAIQTTGTATPLEAHATVATGPAAAAYQSSGTLSTTTESAIYTGSTGTLTTQLPWEVDGSITVGATAPTNLKIGFFSISASDAVTVKAHSYCALTP